MPGLTLIGVEILVRFMYENVCVRMRSHRVLLWIDSCKQASYWLVL